MLLVEKLLASSVVAPVYVEDVFSTYLYTGTGAAQSISNGIDVSTYGGLVWLKNRTAASPVSLNSHLLFDTARGATKYLASNDTIASTTDANTLTAFNTTGFTLGTGGGNETAAPNYLSWTFRKQTKFFDIVTYTGNGASRTVAHNLGSVPGCIIIKRTDAVASWYVYHRSLLNTESLTLNSSAARATGVTYWDSTTPTSSVFSLGTDSEVNANGGTYVAYLFAHDAGGFGNVGADNIISCGSYAGNGTNDGPSITLGYEPQWVLVKAADGTPTNWSIVDITRALPARGNSATVAPNSAGTESLTRALGVTPSGFKPITNDSIVNGNGRTYIYIAIRRAPMKLPTNGTQVFNPVVYTGTNVDNRLVNTSIAPDMIWARQRDDTVLGGMVVGDRQTANGNTITYLLTGSTGQEVNDPDSLQTPTNNAGNSFSAMNGFGVGNDITSKLNASTVANNQVAEAFKRAPGVFDIVSYAGTSVTASVSHNLGVPPELLIVKARNATQGWPVYYGTNTSYLMLNTSAAPVSAATYWNNTTPTSAAFTVGTAAAVNQAAGTEYSAYLFASLNGVSKVGTYTGTAAQQGVNCGFTGPARFVLVKRTDAAGNWYLWDSARGIVANNDPYLLLDTTAAEVTTTDFIDTTTTGFEITAAASATVNINTATYIYLAIS